MIADFFSDYTLRNVILGSMILGIASGALGCFAVLRQRSLLGDTMSHAALPGIALAFLISGSKAPLILLIGAALAGWLGTWFILGITSKTALHEDSAQGIVLSVFFGFGLVLLSYIQRMPTAAKAGLDSFLFGQAATLLTEDIIVMASLGMLAMFFMCLFWKEFKIITFDLDYSESVGFPARKLEFFITVLIVTSIVIGLQTVGVVLMSAMVVVPAVSARQWTNRIESMVFISACFGALAGVSGAVFSSFVPRMPTGPAIVIALGILAGLSMLIAPGRGLISQLLRRYRNRRTYAADKLLEGLWEIAKKHKRYDHPHKLETLRALFPERPRSVDGGLDALVQRGLVQKDSAGRYALSAEGWQRVEDMHKIRM